MSALPAASSTCCWCAEPNQSASSSAWLRMRCSAGARAATTRWASSSRAGIAERLRRRRRPRRRSTRGGRPLRGHHTNAMAVPLTSLSHGAGCGCKLLRRRPAPDRRRPAAPGRPARARRRRHRRRRRRRAADRRRSRSCRPPTSSRRSSTTRTSSAGSPPPTRCRTSTRWAAGRCRALNLVAFPLETLGPDVLREILRGGADAVAGGRRLDRRRALDRRPRAEVRPGGHRRRRPARGADQRRRAAPATRSC